MAGPSVPRAVWVEFGQLDVGRRTSTAPQNMHFPDDSGDFMQGKRNEIDIAASRKKLPRFFMREIAFYL
jgi:hypothetical protein